MMKNDLSVFGLFVRSSFYKILCVIALMLAVQGGLLANTLYQGISYAESGVEMSGLYEKIFWTVPAVCFGGAFLLTAVFLCLPGCEYGAKTGYTLRRLMISEDRVLLCQMLYNFCVILLFWASEVLLVFGFSLVYEAFAPAEAVGTQTVFLAFYQNTFLHALLPLQDTVVWIGNFLLAALLAVSFAEFPYRQRRGKFDVSAPLVSVYALFSFSQEIGNGMRMCVNGFLLLVVLFSLIQAKLTEGEVSEEIITEVARPTDEEASSEGESNHDVE